MSAVDLRHIDTWIFDLDNTVYPPDSGLMAEIDARMTGFVARVAGLPRDEAYGLQKRYLTEHGLTLRGLMLDHGVDPSEFHALFHDLSLDTLARDPALIAALGRLPGRRMIFTNADAFHAERVLTHLDLSHLFEAVFHIDSFGFRPKPDPVAFARMTAEHDIDPRTAAFFEDSERNLAPAAAIGMTTILVGPHALTSTAAFVHHRTDALAAFLEAAQVQDHRK